MTEVNNKTRIPPTASLKKTTLHSEGRRSPRTFFLFFLLLLQFKKKKNLFFLPTFDLCRSQTMYFIAFATYIKNVKSFIKILFWPSALWLSELSNTQFCINTHTHIYICTLAVSSWITTCIYIHNKGYNYCNVIKTLTFSNSKLLLSHTLTP